MCTKLKSLLYVLFMPVHNAKLSKESVLGIEAIDMRIVSRPRAPPPSPFVKTVSPLNWLTVLPSYEGGAAVEGVKSYFCF
jgi:hypothetical protein